MIDVLRIVLFLLWVNGLPPLVAVVLRERFGRPVDNGLCWFDGRPLFGRHKTIRGVIAGGAGGALVAPLLLGQPWWVGGQAAFLAMAGDLFSSFVKRRSSLQSGKAVAVFDQLFEALLPLFYLHTAVGLVLVQHLLVLLLFITVAYWSSRFWLSVTWRPLPKDYPRTVRSSVRFREWRACHEPLARYQTWFNLTSFLSDQILLTWFFKITGLYARGTQNALQVKVEETTFVFSQLPNSFDGFTILLLTDLHLDGLAGLDREVARLLAGRQVDICCIGGDVRMKLYGPSTVCIDKLKEVLRSVKSKHGMLGVLGNHDCIEMLPEFEEAGVVMLVNDSWPIEQDGEWIWFMGVDDPHYYRLHDAEQAAENVDREAFSIFLAHSPEAYLDAANIGADLYLCGHTHGGQICLQEGVPILTNSRAPRSTAVGEWRHGRMQGYTSRGVGPSSIPVRFNCPGEIALITLRKG